MQGGGFARRLGLGMAERLLMSEERFDFYANGATVTFSMYDVTLQFKQEMPATIDDGKPSLVEVSDICNIRMSPQHAKSLVVLLFEQVNRYEKEYDVRLPAPEHLAKTWNELVARGHILP